MSDEQLDQLVKLATANHPSVADDYRDWMLFATTSPLCWMFRMRFTKIVLKASNRSIVSEDLIDRLRKALEPRK